MSKEQKQVVNHILLNRDFVILIQGRAGTGKTTMMTEAVRAIESRGKQVFAFAPTAEASRGVLRAEGFEKADTVASLLTDKKYHHLIKGQVIWIDEAGLIGSRDMLKVLKLAQQQNCRVIFTGDDRQHRAVDRGDAFRILKDIACLPVVGTQTIYRQWQKDYREAVADLAEGKTAQAFGKLEKMGAVKECGTDQIIEALTNDYVETVKTGKMALAISPTHKEREKINDSIRSHLQVLKMVSTQNRAFTKLQSLNFTEAQKSDPFNYKVGMVIQTHSKLSETLPKGGKATVEKVENGQLYIKNEKGEHSVLPLEQSSRFTVFNRKAIALAKGDLIGINKNGFDRNKSRLNNGQILEIKGFTKDGHIKANTASSSNRINHKEYLIDRSHENLDYAYCQTSYASQGKTVDRVFIHQPSATFPASSQEQFYVSVSRGRDSVTIYTDDVEALRIVTEGSGRRLSAMELDTHPFILGLEEKPELRSNSIRSDQKPEAIPPPSHIKRRSHGFSPAI